MKSIEDPIEAVYGVLFHIKRTGVELQRETREIRGDQSKKNP
ncbi:MAG: hypothetical protein QW794_05890 [Thermosphaera sp.]